MHPDSQVYFPTLTLTRTMKTTCLVLLSSHIQLFYCVHVHKPSELCAMKSLAWIFYTVLLKAYKKSTKCTNFLPEKHPVAIVSRCLHSTAHIHSDKACQPADRWLPASFSLSNTPSPLAFLAVMLWSCLIPLHTIAHLHSINQQKQILMQTKFRNSVS